MGKDLLREAKGHLAGYRRQRIWKKVVSVMACVVVFCTTYALILPAITLEKNTNCGKEEHVHGESCYAQVSSAEKTVPVCSGESLGLHRHTESCPDENGEYTCGYSDFVIHRHDASCYGEDGTRWCSLPEIKAHSHSEGCYDWPEAQTAHTHTDECYTRERGDLTCAVLEGEGAHAHSEEAGCYDADGALVCETAESAGHVHTDECYTWNRVLTCELSTEAPEEPAEPELVCGKPEILPHRHDTGCYDRDGNRICGMQEVLEHTHSQDCFQTTQSEEQTLICEVEEHTHSLECYSDPNADVESEDVWKRSVSGATLTGVWSDDVIAIANTQLGYQESQANYHVLDDGVTIKGYTRYGDWYGDLYGDWSAMFVSFCLSYADIPQSAVPQESGCSRWVQQLTQKGLYHSSGYEPKKGDLVFFDMDADGASDRVALVSGVTADGSGHVIRFDTVEGDSANRVQKSSYTVGQSILSGFASLPENPTAPQETVPETTAATVPEETTQDPTAETVPEDIVKETVGDIQALPNNTPSAEIQAEGGAGDGLQVGVQMDVEVNGTNIVKIPFTPEFTHSYTFVSKHPSNTDTYGCLYDASGTKVLTSNDDGAGNKQFKITYTLNAGTTYYFGVRYYRDGNFGTVPVALSLGNHEYVKNEDGEYACSCGVKAPSSGTCGEAAYWSLTDGVLTISGSGAMYDFTNSPPVPWTRLKSQISSVKVESGVTGIGRNAFSTLANLTNVTISDTVTNIGSYAFSGCTALNGIAIPNSVTGIGNHAFDNCGAMKDVTIPGSVTSIGDGAFSECKALTSVTIPDSVTSMGESVFKNCFGLTSAKLSSGMTSVPMSTFWACTALKDVYIPDGVTVIGSSAFYCCSSLNSIHIPASVTRIQGNAFDRCRSLEDISIPDGVTSIGSYAFAWCEGITEISIPQSVTSVGGEFLYRCNDLKTIYWNAQGPVELAGQSRIYGQNLDHNDGNDHNQFTLIVGESADVFTGKYFDQFVNMGCGKVEFRSPNFITLSALKSDFTGAPLSYLPESRYYIDASGIFYRVDEASGKAYVAYVPAEVSSFSIPEFILAEDGKTHLPVVGVDTYAFLRSTLSQLSFEAPENITVLSNFAFYGAQNLASINGKTAAPDVLAVLSKAAAGEQLFTGTKISGGGVTTDSMWEKKAEIQLTISTSHGSEDKHDPLMGGRRLVPLLHRRERKNHHFRFQPQKQSGAG